VVDRDPTMRDVRREFAQRIVVQSGGNKAMAARRVGVSRMTMNRWLGDPDDDNAGGGRHCSTGHRRFGSMIWAVALGKSLSSVQSEQ